MNNVHIDIEIQKSKMEELLPEEQSLIMKAISATERSYSIYSNFAVGAAVELANGKVILGANQENAAFPSGLCAERTAIFAAQVQFPDQPITKLAIAARNKNGVLKQPITPCGACRQVILEIEDRYNKPMKIFLYGTDCVYVIKSVKDLLPLSFVGDDMAG